MIECKRINNNFSPVLPLLGISFLIIETTRVIYTATGIVAIISVFMRVTDLIVAPNAYTDKRVIGLSILMFCRLAFPLIVCDILKAPSLFKY
jgi:hypothetical protein